MRILAVVAISLPLLSGCAGMVTANDGERVTLENDGFVSIDSVKSVAVKVCKQNGKNNAELVKTANKNPSFKPGFGAQLSTFQCL